MDATTHIPNASAAQVGTFHYFLLRHRNDQTGLGADVRTVLAAVGPVKTPKAMRHTVRESQGGVWTAAYKARVREALS